MASDVTHSRIMVCVLKTSVQESDEFLCLFWEIESIAITDAANSESELSRVLKQFEQIICLMGGRYEVTLPWKEDVELSHNKQVAMKRLWKLLS